MRLGSAFASPSPRPADAVATPAGVRKTKMRRIAVNGVTLNVAEAGRPHGPLVILLHGFPEFWFEWRDLIAPLAEAGFHVVAPDQRGYNLSDRPRGVDSYRLDSLAEDVVGLAAALGRERFQLVGHDWGGAVAWWVATQHPDRVRRMAILNAAHPAIWFDAMANDPEQVRRSRYVRLMRIPRLPEAMIRLGGYRGLAAAFSDCIRPEAYGSDELDRYFEAWRRPGAITAMLNWYRALFRQPLPCPAPLSLTPPTLLIWGDRDRFGAAGLAERSAALAADIKVEHWPDATHWTPHDAPDRLRARLLAFLDSEETP